LNVEQNKNIQIQPSTNNEHNDKIQKDLETKIEGIEKRMQSLIKTTEEQEKELKDIKMKLKDFNILELLKSFGDNSEDGKSTNTALRLIENIDKKVNAKLKLTDEKMLKVDESNFKMLKEVQNIRNSQDLNNRNIESNKKTIEEMFIKIKDIENQLNTDLLEINTRNKDLENIINNYHLNPNIIIDPETRKNISNKNLKLENYNYNINENIKEEINKTMDEKIKEILKKIVDIEKSFRYVPNQTWMEEVKSEINTLKENASKYALMIDLDETNNVIGENKKELKFLREQYEDLTNNQTLSDDIASLKRKIEILNNKSQEMEDFNTSLDNKINQIIINKISLNENTKKLLDLKNFEEFKSQIIKEFTNVNDNFTHLRKLVDDNNNFLKNKPSYKDMKSLEDEILIKLEDLRLASAKKFAERVETIKNLKYLDQQIKNIIQVYIKKFDRSENWLLAKKPINSNICASCESYIGDLKDNSPYMPWNKYPLRDQGDKVYRLGNGFSKMLQMIQVEENDKKNTNNGNELNDYVKNARKEKTEVDLMSADMQLNKTVNGNFYKSPQKNLPKIKKGILLKARSGINITESVNNAVDINKMKNNLAISSGGNIDNENELDNKINQADYYQEEEDYNIASPKIIKIIKKTKAE
jgi:hypothetical protein